MIGIGSEKEPERNVITQMKEVSFHVSVTSVCVFDSFHVKGDFDLVGASLLRQKRQRKLKRFRYTLKKVFI